MRRQQALISLLGFILVGALALGWTFYAGNKPLLGLDLQGGVSVVLQPSQPTSDDALYDSAISIMNQRINSFGVAEPDIHREGNTIVVQIAGLSDADKQTAIDLVGKTAKMRFRPVLQPLGPEAPTPSTTAPPASTAPGSSVAPAPATAPADAPKENGAAATGFVEGESAAGAVGAQADSTTTPAAPPASTPAPAAPAAVPTAPGATAQPTATREQDNDGAESGNIVLPDKDPAAGRYLLGPVALTGSALDGASASLDTKTGQWQVNPKFKPGADGIDKFNAIASQCYSKAAVCPTGRLAITLDGEVISAPSINAPQFSADQIQITGSFTEDEARNLSTSLKYGSLPLELTQQSSQTVSASLGGDALRAGIFAGAVGLVLVAIYMIAFYRLLGVLAILKLAVEGAMIWAIISLLGTTAGLTLTLAGVTGIIVSIGVSLDSNVVYYEHLREDVRAGRTIRSSVDRSFASAFSTILKADGASLLGAGLLWWLAVGPVRGFAFYLGLSTLLDIISSYFYMRPVVFLATAGKLCQTRPGLFGLPVEGVEAEAVVAPTRTTASNRPSKGKKQSSSIMTTLPDRSKKIEKTKPAKAVKVSTAPAVDDDDGDDGGGGARPPEPDDPSDGDADAATRGAN